LIIKGKMIKYKDQEYKIVCVTPAGRERYISIFKKFIYRKIDEGLIDEWQIWMNTKNPPDIAFLESMEKENPKVKIYRISGTITTPTYDYYYDTQDFNPIKTYKFLVNTHDNNAIYIRFDDDIVWAEENAIERIVQARIDHPDAFVIYPNIINSTICTSWHQEIGALSEEHGIVRRERPDDPDWAYLDAFNYSDSGLIDHIYKTFAKRYNEGSLSAYYLPSRSFDDYKHFSICSICWWGKDHISCGHIEEPQMAWELPKLFKRPVWFVGDALLFHASYHTQREYLDKVRQPYYLDFFKSIVK